MIRNVRLIWKSIWSKDSMWTVTVNDSLGGGLENDTLDVLDWIDVIWDWTIFFPEVSQSLPALLCNKKSYICLVIDVGFTHWMSLREEGQELRMMRLSDSYIFQCRGNCHVIWNYCWSEWCCVLCDGSVPVARDILCRFCDARGDYWRERILYVLQFVWLRSFVNLRLSWKSST